MNSLYVVRRQAGFVVAIAALFIALVVPAFASAAEVTTRSIELSSASKGASDVNYKVTFTTGSAGANAFVVNFCDSPAIGATCNAPAGLNVANANVETADFTLGTGSANLLVVGSDETALSGEVSVEFSGITNPTNSGTIYARIVTYDTLVNAAAYVATESNATDTDRIDTGSVAIAIHDTIAVSGAVNESLIFCVSKATIAANCTGTETPVLELGEGSGATKALNAGFISTGDLFTQISTNAVSGAVVNLKSDAAGCGGLINSSKKDDCFINPATADFDAGQAFFGLRVVADADPSGASGAFNIFTGSGYSDSSYLLNYNNTDESTGVTSVFGDPILDTAGAPASNKNKKLTFGASISNSTPAGKYSANMSLIATGKF